MSVIPKGVSGELIRTAFERCPSGLFVVDRAGIITVVNHEVERLSGYSGDELVGQSVEILLPDRFAREHAKVRGQYTQSPTARSMGAGRELSARHKDGREIPVEIGLSPVDTPEGVFILATVVDVSERRSLEDRLRQTQKLESLGNLAGGIAHDFNNILLGIIGYAELARDALGEMSSVTSDLNVVIDSARRGRDLVNRILFFTRKANPDRASIAPTAPVHEAVQLLRATLPPNIEIRENLDDATPAVVADGHELHQIAMNLATNAAYAMRERGGVMDVQVKPVTLDQDGASPHPEVRPGLYARLSVSDTGTGISPQALARIFEPFFTTKPQGEGTGLGLSVIKQIITSLGGAIEVSSRAGEGTRFEVYLPAARAHAVRPERGTLAHVPHRRILLVEDEERLARLGQRVLEAGGFEVSAHTSSLQALEEFRLAPADFDLLVTDNTMPHLTGLQLVEKIRQIRPDLPILVVSGIGESMSIEELKRRGVTRLLPKPYRSADLRAAAQELVAGAV